MSASVWALGAALVMAAAALAYFSLIGSAASIAFAPRRWLPTQRRWRPPA